MGKPLEHIKVLDLTRVLVGPFCTMLLNDLGAEVIKLEIPGTGDDARGFGPFKNHQSLYFLSVNRGKKSLSLNLKTEKGKAIFCELVKNVDVLVENYRPGTMEKLGIGYDTLKEINPRLIYAASSGFGHTGPESRKPAYDILAQAMGGIMSITGWPDAPPTRVGMSLGDVTAALFTTIGIASALYQRTLTGEGQKIDVAMLDAQVAILENALVRYQVDQVPPRPIGNRHPTVTPFQAFKAKDRYFVVAVGNDVLWERFCQAIEREDLTQHERFSTNRDRTDHLEELIPLLEPIFLQKTAAEWLDILTAATVPCGPINNVEDLMHDKQILARNMLVDVHDDQAGTVKIAGNVIKMTTVPEEPTRPPAPQIGEHNVEILGELLGYSLEQINALKAEGVL